MNSILLKTGLAVNDVGSSFACAAHIDWGTLGLLSLNLEIGTESDFLARIG
jgi:hypothetical protein